MGQAIARDPETLEDFLEGFPSAAVAQRGFAANPSANTKPQTPMVQNRRFFLVSSRGKADDENRSSAPRWRKIVAARKQTKI